MTDDPLAEIRAGIAARLEERRLLMAGDEGQVAKARDRVVQKATNFLVRHGTPPSPALAIAVQTLRHVRIPMQADEARRVIQTLIDEADRRRRR